MEKNVSRIKLFTAQSNKPTSYKQAEPPRLYDKHQNPVCGCCSGKHRNIDCSQCKKGRKIHVNQVKTYEEGL
ncbi:hypothetical protein CU098_007935 [Rhizopus stolonifer]|uniref:Uncharacterized protein n=1 Tax=Rhizopus stolonifer TaxID=4846 RepID=A0A367IZF2_RHIST|nr:hypothetical protein CU098_007935 [Rhizopus stolonifer]